LFDQTPVIEKEFDEPLTWDEKPGTRKSLISASRHSFNPAIAGLSGVWNGTYSYSDGRKSVPFIFSFGPTNCRGRSEEPNTFGNKNASKLFANLSFSVTSLSPGQTITITKIYDGTGGVSHTIIYTGKVSSDLRQISGQWAINAARSNISMSR